MKNKKKCILIVDDEIKIVRVLHDFFKMNDFEIVEAYNGNEALEVFYKNSERIDLVLLDVMMPGLNGYEVLEQIRSNSVIPVIMLTAKGEEYDQIRGFSTGVDDYVVKPFSTELLYARVEAVLKRTAPDIAEQITMGMLTIIHNKRKVCLDGKIIELTRREYDLLYYFMLNNEMSLTREQILNGVWGYEYDGDFRTVDTHVKQLRMKLGIYAGYIQTIRGVGYRMEV